MVRARGLFANKIRKKTTCKFEQNKSIGQKTTCGRVSIIEEMGEGEAEECFIIVSPVLCRWGDDRLVFWSIWKADPIKETCDARI